MAIFATQYVYGPAEEQAKYRPEHRQYLGELVAEGKIIASGPFVDNGEAGALLLFVAEAESDVITMVEKDPMRVGGVVLSYSIREWNPVLGKLGA